VGQPRVDAWRPPASTAYRLEWAQERIRDRFWIVPAALLLSGAVLAVLTVEARQIGVPAGWRSGFSVDPGEAAGFLGIIASSTLTFLGVVFTLTLVALQLASSQLSPRVIRNFVRSGVTKVAFGILLATFSYAVTVLVLNGGHRGEADSRAVTMALALVAASLAIFVGYVAATLRLLQVVWVIAMVARQTLAAIDEAIPAAAAYQPAEQPARSAPARTISLPLARRRPRRITHGVLLGVDHDRLTRLARRHGCVLEMLVRVGEYVPAGSPVVAVHAAGPPGAGADGAGDSAGRPPDRAVLAGLSLGEGRSLYQDPAFGIRQLADIASQALSPAVNQPTTAVQVIDRLEEILLHLGRRPDRSPYCADQAGTVRLIEPVRDWDSYLDLAFSEITRYGASSPQVARRLLAAYQALQRRLGPGRRAAVRSRQAALREESAGRGVSPAILRPDSMGLG
jgi:uncharacterized membrane protein